MAERFTGVFHGNDESECIDFICAVRQHAIDNDKTQDNGWIANQLYNAFRGKALKWYVRLPVGVRGDWEWLQEALVNRWTIDDEVGDISATVSSPAILPTAAAASPAACPPYPVPRRASPGDPWTGKVGKVRIRTDDTAEVRYIRKDCTKGGDWSGTFCCTRDAAKALKTRLIAAAPDFYRLELVEHESGLSVLAAFSHGSDDWHNGSFWGVFVGVTVPGQGSLKDRQTTFKAHNNKKEGRSWTEKWKLGDNGGLELYGPGDIAEAAQFNLDKAGVAQGDLLFAGPRVSFPPGVVKAHLEFEPLET